MASTGGPSPLETAALQLLEQRDENDSIISAILPALQVLVSGDSSAAVQTHALEQLSAWLTEYRSFKASQQQDSTICMTGWLRKVGTSRLTNQRRWVVLEHSTLYYYADRAETQLKGVLHLPGCRCYFSKSITDLHAHVFTVTTKPLAKSSAVSGSGRSGNGSMLPDELESIARGASAASMGPQCVPLPPADLAVESSNLVASNGTAGGGSLEAEVLNPLHTSKIKYRWAASSEEERNAWVAAIRVAAGRPAIEQVALAWARVLKGALSSAAYKRMLVRMAIMGARLPAHALSLPITVTACSQRGEADLAADSSDDAPPTTPSSAPPTNSLGDADSLAFSPDMPAHESSRPPSAAAASTLPVAAVPVQAASTVVVSATSTPSTAPSTNGATATATSTSAVGSPSARSTPPAGPVAAGMMGDTLPSIDAGGGGGVGQKTPPLAGATASVEPDGMHSTDTPTVRRRSASTKRVLAGSSDGESNPPVPALRKRGHGAGSAATSVSLHGSEMRGALRLQAPPSMGSRHRGGRVQELPPLFASPPALHLSADWIRVVMRSSERLRDLDHEGGAGTHHMPPPPAPPTEVPAPEREKSGGGGFLGMFRRNKSKNSMPEPPPDVPDSSPTPALPASKMITALNPAALAAGVVPPDMMHAPPSTAHNPSESGGMSTPQRPTKSGSGGIFSSGSTPSHRRRGPDSAAAAASSAAAMQSGPVRFRLSGPNAGPRGGQSGPGPSPLRTPGGGGAGVATEDAVAAVAVAEAQRARRFAGHIAGDRVDTAQLQRDFGRDTVVTAVQVHPVYTALTAAHGVKLDPPHGGLRRHVNAAPHEVLSHVTASILEVVGGVNAALAAQYANPVRVPWNPGLGGVVGSDFSAPAALDASFEAALGAYSSDEVSSTGGGSPGKKGAFNFPASPARPSAGPLARNVSNGANTMSSDGSGRPPLHPFGEGSSAGTGGITPVDSLSDGTPGLPSPSGPSHAEHGANRVPVFAIPPSEPHFHLGAWPYPPSSLSSSTDRGTWGGSGLQARVLTFAREILLCSARTITGGDTFDAAAFLFQHPDLAMLMPDSASAPPIRLVVQVLPGVPGGAPFNDGPPSTSHPTHSRAASNDTDGSALSHFTDSLSSSGAGVLGASFTEGEGGGSTDAVPPPVLRVQLQSAMHYRLRSSELEDEELMGWEGDDLGPPLTPLGYAPATGATAEDSRVEAEVLRRRWAEGDWARVTAVFTRDFVWGRRPQPAQIALAVQTHPALKAANGGDNGGQRLSGAHHRRT